MQEKIINTSILVVAAHPDDELLGCGATIARHTARGDEVSVLILGEGITARYATRGKAPPAAVQALQAKAKKANTIVGVSRVFFGDLPDNRFDSVDLLDIVKTIEAVKKEICPTIIYTHFQYDLNIDHRRTYQAVMTATRPVPKESVHAIFSFEVASSSEWNPGHPFIPDYYVKVEKTFHLKQKALGLYRSEMRPYPHPRSFKGIEILARYRGLTVGQKLVEAYQTVRTIQ